MIAAGAAVAGPQIIRPSVLGRGGATSPNNRITVGFIGTGDHGVNWNLGPYLRHPDAQVVAACDLKNVAQRLKVIYGSAATLEAAPTVNGFRVRIEIPIESGAET